MLEYFLKKVGFKKHRKNVLKRIYNHRFCAFDNKIGLFWYQNRIKLMQIPYKEFNYSKLPCLC